MAIHSYESVQKEIARLQGLAKRLRRKHDLAKRRARRKVVVLMQRLGVTLEDLTAGALPARGKKSARGTAPAKSKRAPAKRLKRKVPIKYRGPKRGETWTGRGKPPRWMAALIAEGKKKEDFLI